MVSGGIFYVKRMVLLEIIWQIENYFLLLQRNSGGKCKQPNENSGGKCVQHRKNSGGKCIKACITER